MENPQAPLEGTVRHTARQFRLGFTLLESLLASAILALAVAAVMMPFTAGARNEHVDRRRTVAAGLAQEMMEEVLSRPFEDPHGASSPGPEPGEAARAGFDNIDDYHGHNEAAGNVTDFAGAPATDAGATDLSRHVTAQYVYVSGQDVADPPTFVLATVEVRHVGRTVATLKRLVYKQ